MSDHRHDDLLLPQHRRRERRAAYRTLGLTALLQRRPDLAGVHEPADFAVETVRWCV